MTGGAYKSNTRRTNSLQVYFCTLCKVFEEKTSSDMGPKERASRGIHEASKGEEDEGGR